MCVCVASHSMSIRWNSMSPWSKTTSTWTVRMFCPFSIVYSFTLTHTLTHPRTLTPSHTLAHSHNHTLLRMQGRPCLTPLVPCADAFALPTCVRGLGLCVHVQAPTSPHKQTQTFTRTSDNMCVCVCVCVCVCCCCCCLQFHCVLQRIFSPSPLSPFSIPEAFGLWVYRY